MLTSLSLVDELSPNDQKASTWLSNLDKDTKSRPTISPHLPALKPADDKVVIHADEDLYLGWTLFKSADRQELGLKEENPRMINVKHIAQTYVVGIPEEYADAKSKGKEMVHSIKVVYILSC
jgi:hypothetical protein